jgi:hypothetical protein
MSWEATPRIAGVQTHSGLNGPTRDALFLGHFKVGARRSWTPAASTSRRPTRGKFATPIEPTGLTFVDLDPVVTLSAFVGDLTLVTR